MCAFRQHETQPRQRASAENAARTCAGGEGLFPLQRTHQITAARAPRTRLTTGTAHGSACRRSVGSGGRLGSSRTLSTTSSCHRTRCSSTRFVTSSGSTSTRPTLRWCCASTRSHRSKRSTAPLPVLPLIPGTPERRTHDYRRHGTTNLYAALDVASGHVIADMTPRHRAEEFRRFLNLIDHSVPADLDVHVIVDNNATHKTPAIQRWLLRHPRFTLHFTPTYSSLAEPGRALVRRAHQPLVAPRHTSLDS